MANGQLGAMVGHLRRLAGDESAALCDRQLLERFVQGDQAAFAAIVERHGTMVLAVCRRVLGNHQDAEDAFQATFLVLAKKANAGGWDERIGGYLYEVAIRTAQKARVSDARRKAREKRAGEMKRPEPTTEEQFTQAQGVLDEEVHRLPSQYVMPIVLCCLQGLTQQQAAEKLGVTEGTVRARLWRGRELLRKRLDRRGVSMTAAVLTTFLTQNISTAAVPSDLVARTAQAATDIAAGAATVAASETSVRLAEGVLSAMIVTKLKLLAAFFVAVALTVTGVGVVGSKLLAEPPAVPAEPAVPAANGVAVADDDNDGDKKKAKTVEGVVKGVDAEKNLIAVAVGEEEEGKREETYDVAKDVKLLFAGTEPVKLAELKAGMHFVGTFNDKETALVEVKVSWPSLEAKLKEIDAAGKIVLAIEVNEQELDLAYPFKTGAAVVVDGFKAGLADLEPGKVKIDFSPDKKTVVGIRSSQGEKSTSHLPATLKGIDANAVTVLVGVSGFGDDRKVELSLPLAKDAKARYQGKDAAFVDLKGGQRVQLKLAADRRTVVGILADDADPKGNDDD